MIPEKLHAILTEALNGKEYDGKPVLSFVVSYEKDAETFKSTAEKFEKDNKQIIDERNSIKAKVKEVEKERDNLKDENEKLSKNQKSDKEKRIAEKGMTEEVEAEFNKMKQDYKKLLDDFSKLDGALKEEKKKKVETDYNAAITSLESDIIKALAGENIVDQPCINAALGQIRYEGLAKIITEEDGTFKRFVTTKAENGDTTSSDVAGLAKYIARINQRLVNSSQRRGVNENHERNTNRPGAEKIITDNYAKDLKRAEADLE